MQWQWAHTDMVLKLNLLEDVHTVLSSAVPLPFLEKVTLKSWVSRGHASLTYFQHPTLPRRIEEQLTQVDRFPGFKHFEIFYYYSSDEFQEAEVDEMENGLRTEVEHAMSELHRDGGLQVALYPYRARNLGFTSI
jgi:hypothetical protein